MSITLKCSKCGKETTFEDDAGTGYCTSCGARMEIPRCDLVSGRDKKESGSSNIVMMPAIRKPKEEASIVSGGTEESSKDIQTGQPLPYDSESIVYSNTNLFRSTIIAHKNFKSSIVVTAPDRMHKFVLRPGESVDVYAAGEGFILVNYRGRNSRAPANFSLPINMLIQPPSFYAGGLCLVNLSRK